MKMKLKKVLNGKRAVFLTVLFLVSIGAGLYFLLIPRVEKSKAQTQQNALLESITQGDGTLELSPQLADVDFYAPPTDGAEETPDIIPADLLPLAVSVEEMTAINEEYGVIAGLGILTIEKIDLKLPISEGVNKEQLKISPGHVPPTPAIGETGNAVIAGHRSYEYGEHFNRLGELETGDLIQYQSKDGEVMTFTVFEIIEIVPGDQTAFVQPEDAQIITLYTCTPIRTATHRLLVRASRI